MDLEFTVLRIKPIERKKEWSAVIRHEMAYIAMPPIGTSKMNKTQINLRAREMLCVRMLLSVVNSNAA